VSSVKKKQKVIKTLGVIVVLAIALAAAGAYVLVRRVYEPYQGYQHEQLLEIPSGSGPAAIGRTLVGAGVVRDELTFRMALWLSGNARRLQAGEYRFDRPLSSVAVIDKIARGEVDLQPLTFREGLTIREMAEVFEKSGRGSAAAFIEAASDPSPIRSLDPAATDLEGYLFPDTYSLPRQVTAARVVRAMVDRFQQGLSPEITAAAKERDLSVRELVTLASLVEKETGRAEERPIVAAVYANRLRIGMGLQCDPTVIYALQKAGRYDGNLRRDDLAFDSPYNTYRYAGLPPGPIAAPGQGSLAAAARPAQVPYLYFVSRNDGSHEFATTLDEHNRNVRKYQVQYFRERRLSGRGPSAPGQ
jgi:UPF0755 protein